MHTNSAIYTILAGIVASLQTAHTRSLSALLPPSQDPWYTAPENFETAAPGDILRLRHAPGNITSVFSNSLAAYNILYRSTDAHYQPSWAVTTLFIPKDTNNTALLSYQIPYDSANVNTSPSYSLYSTDTAVTITNTIYNDIQTALGYGWYVSVPDYEGPKASFGAGVQAGLAVIDSVRAVLRKGFGLATNARYSLWGYSGGSIASEKAAELQIQYAPELEFAGVAVGGLVANLMDILPVINGTIWAGLAPEALLGLTSQYPEAYRYMLSQLKTEGAYNRTTFFMAKTLDLDAAQALYNGQDIYRYFHTGEMFIETPIIKDIFIREGEMGTHGTPRAPLFIYKAVHDEVTPIKSADKLVDWYCSVDANIIYERNTIGGHIAEGINGDQRALQWLSSVMTGTYNHSGCTVKDVAINMTDSPV